MYGWTGLRSKSVILNMGVTKAYMDFHKYISGHVCMYVYNDFSTHWGYVCTETTETHVYQDIFGLAKLLSCIMTSGVE